MENIRSIKRPVTKFNHILPVNLDLISEDEKEQALTDFSEGSFALKKCLSIMWLNGLKTIGCCASHHDLEPAYIMMDVGSDVFGYLSDELLLSENIALEYLESEKKQIIRIAGSKEEKEETMLKIAYDILTEKKDNELPVLENLRSGASERFKEEWFIHLMKESGIPEDEIADAVLSKRKKAV